MKFANILILAFFFSQGVGRKGVGEAVVALAGRYGRDPESDERLTVFVR